MPTSIRPFRGVQNNLEDPDEYIEDLEWAYAQDYQSAEPFHNVEAKQIYINKTYRILFRNNLEEKAVEWYLNLGASIRKDWDTLKASFLEHFKFISRDSQTRLWEKKVELANLRQGNNKGIAQFLKRAKDLADQIPDSKVDVSMAVIQGMSDKNEKKRISFEYHKDSDFTFVKVKKLIRTAFFEVGKTSLFDSTYPTPSSLASPATSEEALCQMAILASTSLPSILQGIRSIGTELQNLNRVPVLPQPPAQVRGVQRAYKTHRDLSDIRCFTCKQMGHYASAHRESEVQQPWASGALFPLELVRRTKVSVSVPVKIMNSKRRKKRLGNVFLVALVMEKKQDVNNRQTSGGKEVGITRTPVPIHRWAFSSVDRPALDNLTLENKLGKTSIGCSRAFFSLALRIEGRTNADGA